MIDYTLLIVLIGSSVLGLVAGCLGSFAVLRKQSLLGDAISHAALPGIALAFLITLSKHPLILLTGAFVAGWIATIIMLSVTKRTKLKEDAALGIVLSVLFGTGIVMLSIIQRMPTSNKAGLETFLFGQAATLLKEDVILMSVLATIVLVMLYVLWKEFKVATFDPLYAQSLGFSTRTIDLLIMSLLVIAIVIGLQTVGVVLMSALLIAPAVAARQWTDDLGKMVMLSGCFGALSGVGGVYLSSLTTQMPTGPVIVLVISAVVLVSLFCSPHRGLIKDAIKNAIHRKHIEVRRVLCNLYYLAQSHNDVHYAHDIQSLQAIDSSNVEESVQELIGMGFVVQINDKYALTKRGVSEVKTLVP